MVGSYYVYVIELDDGAGPRTNPDKPVVYVGQSAVSPPERFKQHQEGYKASRWVRDHGVRLRPRLYEQRNPIATRDEALGVECRVAERLRARGFTVRGGH